MKRLILQVLLVSVVMVPAGEAQNTTKTTVINPSKSNEPKVIDPFSQEYKDSLKTEKSSGMLNSTSSRKVKYIDTLTQNTTEPPAQTPSNSTIAAQTGSNSTLPSNTTGGAPGESLKIFKSK